MTDEIRKVLIRQIDNGEHLNWNLFQFDIQNARIIILRLMTECTRYRHFWGSGEFPKLLC